MKKKVVRKLMALALVSAMATSMLAGCGSSDDSGKDSGKDADKGSEETVLKVAAFEGGNGTQIWEDVMLRTAMTYKANATISGGSKSG